jgi:hypothetical protein
MLFLDKHSMRNPCAAPINYPLVELFLMVPSAVLGEYYPLLFPFHRFKSPPPIRLFPLPRSRRMRPASVRHGPPGSAHIRSITDQSEPPQVRSPPGLETRISVKIH